MANPLQCSQKPITSTPQRDCLLQFANTSPSGLALPEPALCLPRAGETEGTPLGTAPSPPAAACQQQSQQRGAWPLASREKGQ